MVSAAVSAVVSAMVPAGVSAVVVLAVVSAAVSAVVWAEVWVVAWAAVWAPLALLSAVAGVRHKAPDTANLDSAASGPHAVRLLRFFAAAAPAKNT